jgi:Rrf2 family protein
MRNTRFTIAIHILTATNAFNALSDNLATSDDLAWSISTNPVVVRRILRQLGKAGLVTSKTGPKGGVQLAHSPEDITLLDVYRAIEEDELFGLHANDPNPACNVGGYIQPVLLSIFGEAAASMEQVLGQYNIADVTTTVLARSQPSDEN